MSPPQGQWFFPGLAHIVNGTFTLGHGVSPSQAMIYCAYQSGQAFESGTLQLQYGGLVLAFPQAKINFIELFIDGQGRQLMQVAILDRRWKWAFGAISGFYNTRVGSEIDQRTKKNARELATLCLQAMGEKNFNVAAIPQNIYPEVEWDYTVPAKGLQEVCDRVGCRVVLKLNNTVACETVGVGANLPLGGDYTDASLTVDPGERPDELIFIGDYVLYQVDLPLEAVIEQVSPKGEPLGIDVPLDEFEAAWVNPDTGKRDWRYYDLGMAHTIPNKKVQEIVKRDAFRKYRVKVPFPFQYQVAGQKPGAFAQVKDLKWITPIEDRMLDKSERKEGNTVIKERKPAIVWGLWHAGSSGVDSSYHVGSEKNHGGAKIFFEAMPKPDLAKNPQAIFRGSFTIDAEKATVEFSDVMTRRLPANTTEAIDPIEITDADGSVTGKVPAYPLLPAAIFLRTAIGVRHTENRGWLRHPISRRMPGRPNNTQPEYVRQDDVRLEYTLDFAAGNVKKSNMKEYEAAAKHYLDNRQRELQLSLPASVTYAGGKHINPDGAIWSVTWETTAEGFCYTRASRNRIPLDIGVVSYEERRRQEKLAEAIKEREAAATERAREEKRRKGA